MGDPTVKIMGGIDILAAILIMFAFDFKAWALVFGIVLIGKGGMSLVG